MPCTRLMKCYLDDEGQVVFVQPGDAKLIELPCGRCPDCRVRKSRDWAIRISHEAREYDANCFLTLTYDQEHLPRDLSLDVRHWQLFAKRLRKSGIRFRYYHVGEYGERTQRPHYHAALFGVDFLDDRALWKDSPSGPLFTSPTVERAWGLGHHSIGRLTFESAGYVAKYMSKKEPGDRDSERYERRDALTGEVWRVRPEYATMSRGGRSGEKGIGSRFIARYMDDVFKDDSVVIGGMEFPPPKYYSAKLREFDEGMYEKVIAGRRERASARVPAAIPGLSDAARESHTKARLALRKDTL